MGLTLTFPAGGMLVTGGTGNVGGGIVRQLAKAGVPVVFTYFGNAEKANALVDEVTLSGASVWAQPMDMADSTSIQAALDMVVTKCGGIHGVACGAGNRMGFNKLMDFPLDVVERHVNHDALGYFRVFHAAVPMLRAAGGGTLTTCSTIATKRVLDYDGMSPVSKGSVDALVRQVASEEAVSGIRCNGVAIGWIEERTMEDVRARTPAEKPNDPTNEMDRIHHIVHQLTDWARLGRVGRPEEAGNLFAFLASNEASYINGQMIAVDAGASL